MTCATTEATANSLSGTFCPVCDYDWSSHKAEWPCPECGSVADIQLQRKARAVATDRASFMRTCKVWTIAWGVILLTYAIGAAALSSYNPIETFAGTFIGLGIGAVGSAGMGLILLWRTPVHLRKTSARAWLSMLIWFHVPWLVIAPLCGLALVFVLLFGSGVSLYLGFMLGVPLWFVLAVIGLVQGLVRLNRCLVDRGIRRRWSLAWAWLGIVVWLVCLPVGFMGGVFGMEGILAQFDPAWEDWHEF